MASIRPRHRARLIGHTGAAMSDELKIGYGRFDPNPQPLTEAQRAIMSAIPLATFAERREAEIATLRAQLADAVRDRDAALANVAVLSELVNHPMLREMLGKIEDSNTPESDLLWTYAMGWLDAARNALEKTR